MPFENAHRLLKGRQKVLNGFESGMISIKKQTQEKEHTLELGGMVEVSGGKQFKILTPKEMLQRLPIAPAQVKAGNISKNLLNEIRQIIYSLYSAKEITKYIFVTFLDSTKLKIVWKKQNFSNNVFQSYYDLFQVNWLVQT